MSEAALVEVKRALQALMGSADMTQDRLADATGLDQGRISRITNPSNAKNRPTLDELAKIEAACKVKPGYVLGAAGLTTVEGTRAGVRARAAGARRGTSRSS